MKDFELQKKVSRKQFAAACKENKSKSAVSRVLGLSRVELFRLECIYDIDLPNGIAHKKFDYDKIYETYLKNERDSKKTGEIIGCHIGTVLKIVRQYKEGKDR
jgi:hypothetical protein